MRQKEVLFLKIICKKSELNSALLSLCRIVPTRTNMPILSGCLLEAAEQTLTLQCTDQEINLKLTIPARVEEEGAVVVAARHLSDLLRRIESDEISISWSSENNLLLMNYGSAESSFFTWYANEFPGMEKDKAKNSITFAGDKWKKATAKVITAAAQQDVRVNYAGVYVRFEGEKIQMAATDGYRLAFFDTPNTTSVANSALFIPVKALIEVNRLAADNVDLEISWDESSISFQGNDFKLISRLINIQFPDYKKVIPKEPELKIEITRDVLLTTLERASLFVSADEHYAIACLNVEGDRLAVTAQASELGSLLENISLQEPAAKKCKASFNARYLLDPLQVMDKEKVTLCLNGESGPAVYLEDDDQDFYLHLISPVCRAG